jgi:hypothetical protein
MATSVGCRTSQQVNVRPKPLEQPTHFSDGGDPESDKAWGVPTGRAAGRGRVSSRPHPRSGFEGPPAALAPKSALDVISGSTDEVRASAPRIHVEENPSDQPADAIAIELK